MDSQQSASLQHEQPPFQPTRTMAAPPTPNPPPSQSHQQEQSNDVILPANITFRQPQQNLPSPLSGQNPKTARGSAAAIDGATAGSAAAAAVGTAAESSKKRGRPRKAPADGNNGVAGSSSEMPSKKVQGRTPGSGKKHQQPEASGAVGLGSMRHIPVLAGEDIVSRVISSLEQGAPAVSVLTASGSVRDVTLQQSATRSNTLVHEGEFTIISLSGTFSGSESDGTHGTVGNLSVVLLGPDKKVFSGIVVGKLTAASPVQMFVS